MKRLFSSLPFLPLFLAPLFLAPLLLTSACSTSLTRDIEVEVLAEPEAVMSPYKTYAWLAGAQVVFDPDGLWEPPDTDIDADVRFIINRELRKKGIYENSAKPDIYVAYAAGIDMEALQLSENPDSGKKLLTAIPKAALVVALVDAGTGYLVWLGQAVGNAQQAPDAKTTRKRIEYAVVEMFKQLQ